VARGHVGLQVALERAVDAAALVLAQPGGVEREVAAVGGQRQAGQAVLDPQRVDEGVDRRRVVGVPGARRARARRGAGRPGLSRA
jgi:hypothetical protein